MAQADVRALLPQEAEDVARAHHATAFGVPRERTVVLRCFLDALNAPATLRPTRGRGYVSARTVKA
eukprot:8116923-Pyramimonas_sp.AAC.1